MTDSMRFVPAGLPRDRHVPRPEPEVELVMLGREQSGRFAAAGGFWAGGVWAFDAACVATVRSNTNSARVMQASAGMLRRPRAA